MLSRFHLIPEGNGQTDGRTDRQICYINIARQYADARSLGAADLPRRPLADKLLHVAIVPANGYQRTKFQLSSSISLRE